MKTKYDNISVTAFISWQGKALLVQRAADERFLPNYWEQMGGKVDPGETQEEAVIREVKEEASIDVKPVRSYNWFEYAHSDGRFMCEVAYVCELTGYTEITDAMCKIIHKGFEAVLKDANLQKG